MWKALLIPPACLRSLPALFLLISISPLFCLGQDKAAAAPESAAPGIAGVQAPDDLALLAAKENGLGGEGVGPWHLKASFTVLDDAGTVTDEGTYEKFWVSETQYKRVFAGKAFTQTDYGTEKGIFRAGLLEPVPVLLEEAEREFTYPFPGPTEVAKAAFDVKEIATKSIKLECLHSSQLNSNRTYCVTAGKPYLRVTSSAMEKEEVLHNRILAFNNRFIAGDLQFVLAGKRRLTSHLESIESQSR